MAYIPLSDVAGGLGSGFSGASRDIMAIQQARQLAEQRRQAMELAKQEEARAQAEEQRRQAAETAKTALRPLDLAASQYALRGQLLGTAKTPEDYATALGEVNRLGLPSSDLPVASSGESTAWKTFTQKPAPAVVPWLPEKWRPAPLMAPDASLPTADQRIGATDMAQVQAAAERGLPLDKQQKFRDQDLGRQIQLANLSRVQDKDALSREWMAFQREAKIQGMTDAEAQRQFQRQMGTAQLGIDYARLDLSKKDSETRAATTPRFTADQTNAATYGRRVEAGLSDLDRIGAGGYDPTAPVNAGTIYALVTGTPGAKLLAGPEARQTAQGYRNIINAILRRESGAAIATSEFDNAQQQYFPALNDDPGTLSQKRRNLEQAMAGLKTGAGAAWDATPQVTAKPAAPPSAPARSARNQQEFNTIWATLKPGETLQDPTGKTWQKGGAR